MMSLLVDAIRNRCRGSVAIDCECVDQATIKLRCWIWLMKIWEKTKERENDCIRSSEGRFVKLKLKSALRELWS